MRRIILAAASAALLFGTGVAEAETFTGRVTSKNPTSNTLTIQTEAGQQMTVRTSDAAIRSAGATIALDRVQVGDRVRVDADAAATGTGTDRAATSVEVVTAAGATGGPAPTGMERTELGEAGGTATDRNMERGTADINRGTGTPSDDATREPAPSGMERTELGEAGGTAADRNMERGTADINRGTGTSPDDATREPAPSGMERTELSESGGTRTGGTTDMERDMERRDDRMARLPDTAGPFPLIGLLGAMALAGAIALRRTRS